MGVIPSYDAVDGKRFQIPGERDATVNSDGKRFEIVVTIIFKLFIVIKDFYIGVGVPMISYDPPLTTTDSTFGGYAIAVRIAKSSLICLGRCLKTPTASWMR